MEKEPMGHFLPCICAVDNTYMPAISVVSVNFADRLEVIIEAVRVDYITSDHMSAYQQATKDYEDTLSECGSITDLNQRIRQMILGLKNKGYVLTPKTVNNLVFNAASPDIVH